MVLGKSKAETIWIQIQDQNMLDIAKVPQFLNFICQTIQANRTLPRTKAGLINEVTLYSYLSDEALNKVKPQINKLFHNVTKEECLRIVAKLAFRVFEETDKITFDENFLCQTLEDNNKQQVIKLFESLNLIEKYKVINQKGLSKIFYSFCHQSFFEYFAGYHLHCTFRQKTKNDLLNAILPYFEFFKWDEPMKIALGLCDQELLDYILSLSLKQDIYLALAYFLGVENDLSNYMRDSLFESVKSGLNTWPITERCFLIMSLGKHGSINFVPFLLPLLKHKHHHVRIEAAEAVGMIGNVQSIKKLIPLFEDKKVSVQLAAMRAVIAIKDSKKLTILFAMLKNKNKDIRKGIARILGVIGGYEAIKDLVDLLNDKDNDVRYVAVKSLGQIGDSQVISDLLPLINKDEDRHVCWAAGTSLGQIGDPRVANDLIPLLRDECEDVRDAVTDALAGIKDNQTTQTLISLLKEDNTRLRSKIIYILGKVGDSQSLQALISLQKEDEIFSCIVAKELGEIGGPKALDALISLSKHEDVFMREETAKAMGEMGDRRAIEALMSLLKVEDYASAEVAKALGKIGDPKAVEGLLPLLKSKSDSLRNETVIALGKIYNSQAQESLIPLLKDEGYFVRCSTAEALGEIGDSQAIKFLLPMLDDEDGYTSSKAVEAIGSIQNKTKEDELPKELIKRVKHLRKNARENDKDFLLFENWREAAKRRGLWFENDEIEIKKIQKPHKDEGKKDCVVSLDFSTKRFKTKKDGMLIENGEIRVNQEFLLLEEVINRKGEIHWTAGFILFDRWQEDIPEKGPVQQFRRIVCTLNSTLGVKILHSKTNKSGKIKQRCWVLNKDIKLVTTIEKAKESIRDVKKLKNSKNIIDKMQKAFSLYPDSISTGKALVKFLDKNQEKLQDKEIIDKVLDTYDLLQKREKDLKSAIRAINSEGIHYDWEGDWAEAKKHVWHLIEEHKEINFYRIIADDLAKIAMGNLPAEDRKCLNLIESIKIIKNVDKAFISKFMQEKEINECIAIAISRLKKVWGENYQKPRNHEVASNLHQVLEKCKFNMRTIGKLRNTLIDNLCHEMQSDHLEDVLGIPRGIQRDLRRFLKAKKELEEEKPGIHPLIEDYMDKLGSNWDRIKVCEYQDYANNTTEHIDVETVSLYQGEYIYEKSKKETTN